MVSFTSLILASALAVAVSATNWTISANSNLTFTPNIITAAEGDWLIFDFYPANHSVASGPFSSPCEPATTGGFFSGYNFATSSGLSDKSFAVRVNNASVPIWFYCTQGKHCANGMVGAVNPTTSKTLTEYQAGAASFAAFGVVPSDGNAFGGTVQSVATTVPHSGTTPGNMPSPTPSGSSASGLLPPTAVVLALAAVALVLV